MKCPRCGHENLQAGKFCSECASPLPVVCPSCEAVNEPAAKFCTHCAAPLTSTPVAPTPSKQMPASSPIPSSFVGSRYTVKKKLGEGGKKRVYLAHDTALDRDVAFALIKAEALDDAAKRRILREAQAMGRLGDHPNIMPIYDIGQEGGQPYMVLPLMQGGDVEHLIEKAPSHRVPLARALELAREVCQGLEFAHSKGIVHRDLKPGNVWLTAQGTARIGDFGLALPLGGPRLTLEGTMVGTATYMPPEQAMGREVTAQADLYSLGCMLYEFVTGRPPFLGDDPVSIIGQHINTAPVAPTWHNPRCPKPLEALIMRLLAKDPSQRPESATDVLKALEGVDVAAEPEDASVEKGQRLEGLAGGVFVGRQKEMGELKAALEEALSGRGRLVMLVGEPGIGKTRTAQELSTYAGLRKAQVLWGRCYEGEGAPPYWPWVQAIRSYVRESDPKRLRTEMGTGAADIAQIVSDVKERLPDLKPPPLTDSPEQARFRLFDSVTSFLKGAAGRQPLVLFLEDLHWADKPSLLLLEFLARELERARLLVVGTYRDVEVSRQHPLSLTLGSLTRERLFQRVVLRGLTQEDVAQFIHLVTGVTPPPGLAKAVHSQTEGNPLFMTEVVRLLVQEGELGPDKPRGTGDWTVRIPEGVRDVIGRRLSRLSERCNQVLTVASAVGRQFEMRLLVRVVEGLTEGMLLEALEEALSARVIEELPRVAGRYQFTHGLIHETLYEELTTTRRVRFHAQIAEALEEIYGSAAEAHAAELAHHYAEAEALLGSEKLVKYSLLAGEKALASRGYEEALAHFQRGLAAKQDKPEDTETADLLFGLGRAEAAVLKRSELQPAVDLLKRAFDLYLVVGNANKAVEVARFPFPFTRLIKGLADLRQRALELVPPDSYKAAELLVSYGVWAYPDLGDIPAARQAFERALAIARREKDVSLEARALAANAEVEYEVFERPDEALEKGLAALALCRELDDPWSERTAHHIVAQLLVHRGEARSAREHARAALALAEKMHNQAVLGTALNQNWFIEFLTGNLEEARAFINRALTAAPDDFRFLCTAAWFEFELGHVEMGRHHLGQLLEVTGGASETAPGNTFRGLGLVKAAYLIGGETEWLTLAETAAKAVLTVPSESTMRGMGRLTLAISAVLRRDVGACARWYDTFCNIAPWQAGLMLMSSFRLLGLLARTVGETDKAVGHFEDALAFCRKAGFHPELAWTCYDYADTLLQRDVPGDRQKAMALLDESLSISRELGMRPLMERVLSRRKLLKA